MTDKVSKSKTGQKGPVPSRAERDAASSSTGGRKAVEVEKSDAGSTPKGGEIAPPVGLDMETRGDEEWSHNTSDAQSSGQQEQSRRTEQKASDQEDVPVDDGSDIEG